MTGEISYDLIMEDDMSFVEGSYRLHHDPWQVFIFRKDPVARVEVTSGHWASGVTGIFVRVPLSVRLNKETVQRFLSEYLEVPEWREVRGLRS